MQHRKNWIESTEIERFNFKWSHVSAGLDFENMSKIPSFKQGYNHLEFPKTISNKMSLFVIIIQQKRGLEIFKFIPFTIIMQYGGKAFLTQFDSFTEIFNNFKNYLIDAEGKRLETNLPKTEKYGALFKLGYECDKPGFKTSMTVSSNFYTGKNIWLVKAVDLNRGRCIRIVNEIEEIKTIIKNFYDGINRSFKKEEDEKILQYNFQ